MQASIAHTVRNTDQVMSRGPEVGAVGWWGLQLPIGLLGVLRADSSLRIPHPHPLPESPPLPRAGFIQGLIKEGWEQRPSTWPPSRAALQGQVGCTGAGWVLRLHPSSTSPLPSRGDLLPVSLLAH